MYIDTHAHFYDLSDEEYNATVRDASENGITKIVDLAVNIETSKKMKSRFEQNGVSVFGAVGVVPGYSNKVSDNWLDELDELIKSNSYVAIGEIGIDANKEYYPSFEVQKKVFVEQLLLAKKYGLPSSIHARNLEGEALSICKELGVEKAVFHCYTGDLETAKRIVDAGYVISFSGIVTFKNVDMDDIINIVPNKQLFLETDSPYLAPVPKRGKKNVPSYVRYIYDYVANVRLSAVEAICRLSKYCYLCPLLRSYLYLYSQYCRAYT